MHEANNPLKMLSTTDEMALIRTKLANERTLLAYLRTFIGSFAAGVGFIKFTGDLFFVRTGFVMVAISPFILVFGVVRFIQVKRVMTLSALGKISITPICGGSDKYSDKHDESR